MRSLLLALPALVFATSCTSNGDGTLTAEDSLAIYNAMAKKDTADKTLKAQFNSMNFGPILAQKAIDMHKLYLEKPFLFNADNEPIRFYHLDLDDVERIKTAMGEEIKAFRVYPGLDSEGMMHLMLMGVNQQNENHLYDNEISDEFKPCPSLCDNAPEVHLENDKPRVK